MKLAWGDGDLAILSLAGGEAGGGCKHWRGSGSGGREGGARLLEGRRRRGRVALASAGVLVSDRRSAQESGGGGWVLSGGPSEKMSGQVPICRDGTLMRVRSSASDGHKSSAQTDKEHQALFSCICIDTKLSTSKTRLRYQPHPC
jgi:hypothetical protein